MPTYLVQFIKQREIRWRERICLVILSLPLRAHDEFEAVLHGTLHDWADERVCTCDLAAMFYVQEVLSKKGPLGKVWLAAHMERKLTKAQIIQTNIQSSARALKPRSLASRS